MDTLAPHDFVYEFTIFFICMNFKSDSDYYYYFIGPIIHRSDIIGPGLIIIKVKAGKGAV